MASQGLRASPEGIRAAKTALTDKTWSQHKLAAALGITRQPVSKFFAGESVSRSCFVQICQQLGLSWQKVAGLPEDLVFEQSGKGRFKDADLDTLVKEVRQKRQEKIQYQCNIIQMLDIPQTVKLIDIYTSINVLEEINNLQWREIDDWLKDFKSESNFNQLRTYKRERKLTGLEAVLQHSKLTILGKPGSGKTIFLKYLAIECNKGQFQPNQIPVFIRAKEFAEDAKNDSKFNLFDYISEEFLSCDVEKELTKTLLTHGKLLILLDGLDEVSIEEIEKLTIEIRSFTQIFYKNRFIISCRIAAHKYRFHGFTEVEVADFDQEQVEVFAKKWFVAVASKYKEDGQARGNLFINQLNLQENQHIRELSFTPLLLHWICLVFQGKNEFPLNQAKLYEQALNILFYKWDEVRGIKRDRIASNLTLAIKKKVISQIAAINFDTENYFLSKEKILELIADYLQKLQLQLDNEAVLKAIEVEHGLLIERSQEIYSFSHLIFQKYFTARNNVENSQAQNWEYLVSHMTEKRWREVFLLTVNMLPNADEILQLMKQKIDLLVANDERLQYFLTWLHQKSSSVYTRHKAAAIRAFYLVCVERSLHHSHRALIYISGYNLEYALVGNIAFDSDLALDEFLYSTIACFNDVEFAFERNLKDALDYAHAFAIAFNEAIELVSTSKLKQALQKLKTQLPDLDSNLERFREWWQTKGKVWGKQLRYFLIKYRNIGYDWEFNEQQKELLQKYYDVNKLLVDCLNSAADVSPTARQKIENTLLLAIADIEKLHNSNVS
ncbi:MULTISPECIES: NACHT domain-containing NTPase [Nostoc]|uniref:NACHT domain-containing NTPase n=1 Tax=Nostoc paludosum FACHB-159 TaxID=2692908 RepID=A0ABR8K1J0_9NOSO|nr:MULTISPECIES: NACHT domain-containing NTPase [Nostoc]MBD2677251.1 NACHT domain-containing NTPase [Nostoc sp. FACHB-857]MBD2732940.1 NACHT domain-containing NTPase [Nostoc paludosum FACHB-159]